MSLFKPSQLDLRRKAIGIARSMSAECYRAVPTDFVAPADQIMAVAERVYQFLETGKQSHD